MTTAPEERLAKAILLHPEATAHLIVQVAAIVAHSYDMDEEEWPGEFGTLRSLIHEFEAYAQHTIDISGALG
jgi:hypothetical protein